MKIKNLLFMMAVALLFTSCVTTVSTYTARKVNIGYTNISTSPVIVDIDVDVTKPMLSCTEKYELKSLSPATTATALTAAYHDCILKNNIHVLVDPIYKTEMSSKGEVTVTVSGLSGYFKNPRTLLEEVQLYKNVSTDEISKYLMIHDPNYIPKCIEYYQKMQRDMPIKIFMDGNEK